jgi:hypothetical protein
MRNVCEREAKYNPFQNRDAKMNKPNNTNDIDLDLTITKIDRRTMGGGTWVIGTVNDQYKFNALVFAEHAESEDYELGKSKISKLWIERTADHKTLFNFDRGLDVPAANTEIQVIVDFLSTGLADLVFSK